MWNPSHVIRGIRHRFARPSFLDPLLRLAPRSRRAAAPKRWPHEMSAHDFEVPPRDAILRHLETWGPALVVTIVGMALLAAYWWLRTG